MTIDFDFSMIKLKSTLEDFLMRRKIKDTDERVEIRIEATDTRNIVRELRRRTKKYRDCHFVVYIKDIDTFMCRRPKDWIRWEHFNTIELKLSPLTIEVSPHDKNEV